MYKNVNKQENTFFEKKSSLVCVGTTMKWLLTDQTSKDDKKENERKV